MARRSMRQGYVSTRRITSEDTLPRAAWKRAQEDRATARQAMDTTVAAPWRPELVVEFAYGFRNTRGARQ